MEDLQHFLITDFLNTNCHCTVNSELCISTEELEKLHYLPQTVYTCISSSCRDSTEIQDCTSCKCTGLTLL